MVNQTYLFWFIALAAIGGMLWVFYIRRFTQHIYKKHPEVYQELGCPPLEIKQAYTVNELAAMKSQIWYIVRADFRRLHDRKFIRFSERLRTLFFIDLLLISSIFFLFFLDYYNGGEQSNLSAAQSVPSPIHEAYDKYQSHEYEESLNILNALVETEPDNADAYYYRGFTHEALNQYSDALSDFIIVSQLNPDRFDVYTHIDWLYARSEAWEKIIPYWNKYIERNPEDSKAYLERGGTYYRAGNLEMAMADAGSACDLGNRDGCRRYQQVRNMLSSN